MNPAICDAIRRKRLLSFWYRSGYCTVEPHTHGESSDGQELLRAFQFMGSSESEEPTGWKLFRVNEIRNLTLLEANFLGPRRGYDPNDIAMELIYCQL